MYCCCLLIFNSCSLKKHEEEVSVYYQDGGLRYSINGSMSSDLNVVLEEVKSRYVVLKVKDKISDDEISSLKSDFFEYDLDVRVVLLAQGVSEIVSNKEITQKDIEALD